MKNKITLLLLISCLNTFSQKWTEMMTDTNANFYNIIKEFDTYWKDRPQTLPSGFYFLSFLIDNKTNYLQFIKN